MNPVAKKIGQVIVGFGLLFAAALAFQNCSGYQVYDASKESLSSTCSGSNCTESVTGLIIFSSNSALDISISNLNPSNTLDVAGYCDANGFSATDIQYQWADGPNVLQGWTWKSTGVKCDELGRFQIAAQVPSIQPLPPPGRPLTHTLHIRIAVSLGSGQFLPGGSLAETSFDVNFKNE